MARTESAARTETAYAPPATQRTNRLAIWSLVLSIVTLGGPGSVAGIIMGIAARRRIAETGERGAGVALAGILVGVLTLIGAIVYWIILARYMGGGGYGGGSGGGGGGGGGGY